MRCLAQAALLEGFGFSSAATSVCHRFHVMTSPGSHPTPEAALPGGPTGGRPLGQKPGCGQGPSLQRAGGGGPGARAVQPEWGDPGLRTRPGSRRCPPGNCSTAQTDGRTDGRSGCRCHWMGWSAPPRGGAFPGGQSLRLDFDLVPETHGGPDPGRQPRHARKGPAAQDPRDWEVPPPRALPSRLRVPGILPVGSQCCSDRVPGVELARHLPVRSERPLRAT